MSRITWQNVAAPDFRAALSGVGQAGDLFGQAASQFSGAMGDIAARGRRDASNAAMEAALAYTDVGSWEQAMAEQGLGALGIRPEQATNDLLNFVSGRRDDLSQNARDDQTLAQNQFTLGRDQYNFGRTQLTNERADQALLDTETDEALRLKVLGDVQGIADGTSTKEEATRAIINGAGDPVMEQMMLQALDTIPDATWQAGSNFEGTGVLDPEIGVIGRTIDTIDSNLVLEQSRNPTLALYTESLQSAQGYASPMDGMIDRLNAKIDPNDPDSEGMVERSSGELARIYNDMGKEFPNVPKNMIATVIENNLEETGMGWIFDNELKPDLSRVRDQLNQVNTPEQLNMLQQERAAIDRRTNENREVRETYERVVQKFELANTREDPEQVAAARRDIQALAETLKGEMEAQGASAAEAEAAAAQMLAEAEAEANPTVLDQPINVGALLDQAVGNTSEFVNDSDVLNVGRGVTTQGGFNAAVNGAAGSFERALTPWAESGVRRKLNDLMGATYEGGIPDSTPVDMNREVQQSVYSTLPPAEKRRVDAMSPPEREAYLLSKLEKGPPSMTPGRY